MTIDKKLQLEQIAALNKLSKPSFTDVDEERTTRLKEIREKYGSLPSNNLELEWDIQIDLCIADTDNVLTDSTLY